MTHQAVEPDHYTKHSIEPIVYIIANKLPFSEGNVVKYITRWADKGGIEDLKKARRYLEFIINNLERGDPLANE